MGNIQNLPELERLDYESYIEDARAKLESEIKNIKAKNSARGVLLSGGTVTAIAELRKPCSSTD
jgi:exopolyphosphatase/pppGpp-phosphohydrolase